LVVYLPDSLFGLPVVLTVPSCKKFHGCLCF
jgi:hypothetical protein